MKKKSATTKGATSVATSDTAQKTASVATSDTTKEPASNVWITANSYSLTVKRSESRFAFTINVLDKNNKEYYLDTLSPTEINEVLIKQVLQAITNHWPDYKWQFQAAATGQITSAR